MRLSSAGMRDLRVVCRYRQRERELKDECCRREQGLTKDFLRFMFSGLPTGWIPLASLSRNRTSTIREFGKSCLWVSVV